MPPLPLGFDLKPKPAPESSGFFSESRFSPREKRGGPSRLGASSSRFDLKLPREKPAGSSGLSRFGPPKPRSLFSSGLGSRLMVDLVMKSLSPPALRSPLGSLAGESPAAGGFGAPLTHPSSSGSSTFVGLPAVVDVFMAIYLSLSARSSFSFLWISMLRSLASSESAVPMICSFSFSIS